MDFTKLNTKLEGMEHASTNGHRVKNLSAVMRIPEIWYLAYANVFSNKGAMTKGIDETTFDGLSEERISNLINAIKVKTYKPKPVRRVYIPKKDGKMRPLGVPSGDDKLVQAVSKILLQQVYEPVFDENSHGFRPQKSCHTAIQQIKREWQSVKWIIEFDIKGFFDNMNHDTLISLLEKKIDDKRFIKLISLSLKAGYLEDWVFHQTHSGTPQGGIISPILSNIYLHEFDTFMNQLINDFRKGEKRPSNPEYLKVTQKIRQIRRRLRKSDNLDKGLLNQLKELQKKQKSIPSSIENTEEYKRLRYVRYAGDFTCGVIGSYKDAKHIMNSIECFLNENLKLTLSDDKTGIRRATKGTQFLSYGINTIYRDKVIKIKVKNTYTARRTISGCIRLSIPKSKPFDFCKLYGYGNYYQNEATHRSKLINASEVEIIETYNAELRGFANYYNLIPNVKRELNHLFHIANSSLLKTLASKRRSTTTKVAKSLKQPNGLYLTHHIKGIAKQVKVFQTTDIESVKIPSDNLPLTEHLYQSGTELTRRLEATECEYCGRIGQIEVHHARKLKDLKQKPHLEHWEKIMIVRNRKTLILCSGKNGCHNLLHQGKLPDKRAKA
jgi:RNA-directed DNA polymerase